jgi:hypothetical protein
VGLRLASSFRSANAAIITCEEILLYRGQNARGITQRTKKSKRRAQIDPPKKLFGQL